MSALLVRNLDGVAEGLEAAGWMEVAVVRVVVLRRLEP